MSNAFAAKRMAQVQIPRNRLFGRDFSMAQGYAQAMEKTLDLLDEIREELGIGEATPEIGEVADLIEKFKEKQYQAPDTRTTRRT